MCSTSQPSTPKAAAAAWCPLSQNTSVSGGGCGGGPSICSCSFPPNTPTPPPVTHPVHPSWILWALLSQFIKNPPTSPLSSAPTWSASIITHLDQPSNLHPGPLAPTLPLTVCPPSSSNQRAYMSTRVRLPPCPHGLSSLQHPQVGAYEHLSQVTPLLPQPVLTTAATRGRL